MTASGMATHPDSDGWVSWKGGDCPVGRRTIVDVRFRDGTEWTSRLAGSLARESENFWRHEPSAPQDDITEYRVVAA